MADEDAADFLNADVGWLETEAINGFKVWHIIAICLGILLTLVVMVCCCIRFRIPRTKQEIEADYQRKQITKKFREKLQHIKNSDMDDMDLQKATTDRCFQYDNNNIYYDNSTLMSQNHIHPLAWQERSRHSVVSLSIVEAGCVALHHVTKEIISQRTTNQSTGILQQFGFVNHIVYPATTYRTIKQRSPHLIANPMIHRVSNNNNEQHFNDYNYKEPKRYYYYEYDKYHNLERDDNRQPIDKLNENVHKNVSTEFKNAHLGYGCNL